MTNQDKNILPHDSLGRPSQQELEPTAPGATWPSIPAQRVSVHQRACRISSPTTRSNLCPASGVELNTPQVVAALSSVLTYGEEFC